MNVSHPEDSALILMAQNQLADDEHPQMVEHLYNCQRCRSYVQDVRELAHGVSNDIMPVASDALLSRIQASRASGVRASLDSGENTKTTFEAPSRRKFAVFGSVGLAAAAAIALMVYSPSAKDTGLSPVGNATAARNAEQNGEGAESFLSAFSPLPTIAGAQDAPMPDVENEPLVNIDALQLKPGVWTYTEYGVTDGKLLRPSRMLYVSLAEDILKARPVWRIVETTIGRGVGADTIWADRATLRPIERRWHIGSFAFSESFSENRVDNVVHHTKSRTNSREYTNNTSAAVNPVGSVIVQEAQLRLALKSQTLHSNWRKVFGASGAVRGPRAGKPSRIVLHVEGSQTIKTVNDNVPCWRVVFMGSNTQVWYVSKQSGDVIRTEAQVGSPNQRQTDLFTKQ